MGLFGKIIKRILIFILDVIIFFVLVALAGWYVATHKTMKELNVPSGIVSEEYSEFTPYQLAMEIYSFKDTYKDLSVYEIETKFPILTKAITVIDDNEMLKKIVNFEELEKIPLGELGTQDNLKKYLTLTFTSISETFGFTLPDIPLINEIKDEYIFDALNKLSAKLDFEKMTVGDLKDNFGMDLLSGDGNMIARFFTYDTKLSELKTAILDVKLGAVLGYEKRDGAWYNGDTAVTGINKAISDITINTLSTDPSAIETTVKNLYVSDILETEESGVMKLINPSQTKISELPDKLTTAVTGATMGDLIDAGLLNLNDVTKIQSIMGDSWRDYTLSEFINELIDKIPG